MQKSPVRPWQGPLGFLFAPCPKYFWYSLRTFLHHQMNLTFGLLSENPWTQHADEFDCFALVETNDAWSHHVLDHWSSVRVSFVAHTCSSVRHRESCQNFSIVPKVQALACKMMSHIIYIACSSKSAWDWWKSRGKKNIGLPRGWRWNH